MPITISRTLAFGLVSVISCSSRFGRFSSVLCIWRSSSLWLEAWSLALLLTLCCMSHCSPLQDHSTHLLFQLVFNLDILVGSSGGDHSNPRRFAWLPYPVRVCILRTAQCFGRFCMAHLVRIFSLPTSSHRQQIDNRLQGIVNFHASFRTYPRHHRSETRRRGRCPHGWSLREKARDREEPE